MTDRSAERAECLEVRFLALLPLLASQSAQVLCFPAVPKATAGCAVLAAMRRNSRRTVPPYSLLYCPKRTPDESVKSDSLSLRERPAHCRQVPNSLAVLSAHGQDWLRWRNVVSRMLFNFIEN
jgi:hypothetical protein